jgi:hypothetical protein
MPAVLGANQYLGIDSLDTDLLFMVVVALGGVVVGLALFRGVGRLRESSNLRKSSWKTFEKVAKVRGLTSLEVSTLRSVVRASKIERPSQVLGSILLFDKCVDRALDKEALSSVEQGGCSTGSGKGWQRPPLSGTGVQIAGISSALTATSIFTSDSCPGTAWTRN